MLKLLFIALFLIGSASASQHCLNLASQCSPGGTPDENALIQLFISTQGVNGWDECANWCSSNPVDQWYWEDAYGNRKGVVSGPPGNYEIDLSDNNLSGAVPSLVDLGYLVKLDISDNFITSLPSDLGNMITLLELDISNNNISTLNPNITYLYPTINGLDVRGNLLCGLSSSIETWVDLYSNTPSWKLFQECSPKTRVIYKQGQNACQTSHGYVSYGGSTIQSVLNLSSNGDNIIICGGTYQENLTMPAHITRNFKMEGEILDDSWATIIDGGNTGTVLSMNGAEGESFLIQNMAFKNGATSTPNTGSAIQSNSMFTLNTCLIESNAGAAAAVANHLGDVFYSVFKSNTSTGLKGGALHFSDPGRTRPVRIEECVFEGNSMTNSGYGAAIYFDNIDASILNTYFGGNLAYAGGAIFSHGSATDHSLVLNGNTFFNNSATIGGALYLSTEYFSEISYSNFESNHAIYSGGAIKMGGYNTNPYFRLEIINQCLFKGNTSDDEGGALTITSFPKFIIKEAYFYDNEADEGAALYNTGTVSTFSGHIYMTIFKGNEAYTGNVIDLEGAILNSLLYDNIPGANSAIVNIGGSGPNSLFHIDNSTVYNNQVPGKAQTFFQVKGKGSIFSTIIWDDSEDQGITSVDPNGNFVFTKSILKGTYSGPGVITDEPKVIKSFPKNSDKLSFRLSGNSPAIDNGNMNYSIPKDLDGNARLIRVVDIGAYEFQGAPDNKLTVINNTKGRIIYQVDATTYGCAKIIDAGKTEEITVAATATPQLEMLTLQSETLNYVKLNGVDKGPLKKITVNIASNDRTVEAGASDKEYTITTVVTPNPADGAIVPASPLKMKHGSSKTFYFIPDGERKVGSVNVTSTSGTIFNGVAPNYFLSDVKEDITITVNFDTCGSVTEIYNHVKVKDYATDGGTEVVSYEVLNSKGEMVQSQTKIGTKDVLVGGYYTDEFDRKDTDVKPFVYTWQGTDFEPVNMHCRTLAKKSGEYFDGSEKPDADGDFGFSSALYENVAGGKAVKMGEPGADYSIKKGKHTDIWTFGITKNEELGFKELDPVKLDERRNASGAKSSYNYFVTVQKNPNGHYSQIIKDRHGNIVKNWRAVSDNLAIVTKTEYGPDGQPVKTISPVGGGDYETLKEYSTTGRVLKEKLPDIGTIIYRYDDKGRVAFVKTQKHVDMEGHKHTECSDEKENDKDGKEDMEDPECTGPLDNTEASADPECDNIVDDDGDGDGEGYGSDPGCYSKNDNDEHLEYFSINTYDKQNRVIAVCEVVKGDFESISETGDCFKSGRDMSVRTYYDHIIASDVVAANPSLVKTEIEMITLELENTEGKIAAQVAYNFGTADVWDFYSYNEQGDISCHYKIIPEWGIGKTEYEYDLHSKLMKEHAYFLEVPPPSNPPSNPPVAPSWKYLYGQNYVYDNLQRLKTIQNKYASAGSWADLFKYDYYDYGATKKLHYYHQSGKNSTLIETVSYAYNIRDWNTSIETKKEGPPKKKYFKQDLDYTGEYSGNVAKNTFKYEHPVENKTVVMEYEYDKADRLTMVVAKDDSGKADLGYASKYVYDLSSRFKSKKEGTTTRSGYDYYDGTNKLKTISGLDDQNFVYDPDGNMVLDRSKKMTVYYNPTGMPKAFNFHKDIPKGNLKWNEFVDKGFPLPAHKIEKQVKMYYDASGNRVLKHMPGTSEIKTIYFFNVMVAHSEVGGTDQTYFNLRTLDAVLGKKVVGGNSYYYVTDNLGSTRMVVKDDKSVAIASMYHSYGEENPVTVPSTETFREKFTSKEFDKEGDVKKIDLYYFGARYYDPLLGYWVSPDAARQFNSLYIYNANNPITYIDPDGNYCHCTKRQLEMEKMGGKATGILSIGGKAINPLLQLKAFRRLNKLPLGLIGQKAKFQLNINFDAIRDYYNTEPIFTITAKGATSLGWYKEGKGGSILDVGWTSKAPILNTPFHKYFLFETGFATRYGGLSFKIPYDIHNKDLTTKDLFSSDNLLKIENFRINFGIFKTIYWQGPVYQLEYTWDPPYLP